MSRFRILMVAAAVIALVSPGVFAEAKAQQQTGNAKIQLELAIKEAAKREAERQAQVQATSVNGNGASVNGFAAGGDAEASDNDAEDEAAYLAEVQAIQGKKMEARFTNAPPVIDGNLNDPEWNFADKVTDFMQREPDNSQPGSERTEAMILFDDNYIYVGFMMYDSQPDRITATDLRRDSALRNDDTIAVLFDTFHDRRNAFLFRVNPLGTKYDAQYRNERQIVADWDERWQAEVQITDEGWVAEFRIPLRALRYNNGSHVWGIDFKRELRRNNEEMNWSNYRRGFQFNQVSQAGNLTGLRNLGLTQRFRFQPYVTGSGSQFNVTDTPYNDADGAIGVEDFKVQITSNLTADITVNTDFAQVEDDSERVNLTRFPLFFPEKREFFLESASNFDFGSSGGRGGGGYGMSPAVLLYHSRRIGLVGGEPVPLLYGAKMTGKVGSTNVGIVNAQTGDSDLFTSDEGEDWLYSGKNFTVLRLKQDVFARSTIGVIYTNAQGAGEYNRVAGVDASFRFWDYMSIGGEIASVVSDSNLLADEEAADNPITGRFAAGWNSDQWNISGTYQRVDADFRTDLGYLRRRDIVQQSYRAGWNPRPGFAPAIRQFRFSGSYNHLTDVDGRLLTETQGLSASTSFQSGDSVSVTVGRDFDRLDYTFWLDYDDGIYVPPGDYTTTDWSMHVNTFNARRISGRFRVNGGGYWNGTRQSFSPGGTVRFNEKFSLSPSYSYNHVDLPTGIYDTHTVSLRATYNFNERWLTNSLVQYNSVSGRASVYARLRYVINEIDSFYLVYKSTRTYDDIWDGIADHQLIAKMTYSVDF